MKKSKKPNDYTTIKLRKSTLLILSERKIHPNQSYEEVIRNLLDGSSK